MPLCLEVTTGFSQWWALAVLVWGLLLPWLMADSRLCKLSHQLIFVTFSWSITITLSFLELAEEDCFEHANIFHPCDVASPAQLHLKQDGLNALSTQKELVCLVVDSTQHSERISLPWCWQHTTLRKDQFGLAFTALSTQKGSVCLGVHSTQHLKGSVCLGVDSTQLTERISLPWRWHTHVHTATQLCDSVPVLFFIPKSEKRNGVRC